MSTTTDQFAPGCSLRAHVHEGAQFDDKIIYHALVPNSSQFLVEIKNENLGFDPNKMTEERFFEIVAEKLLDPANYPNSVYLLLYINNHNGLSDYGMINVPLILLTKLADIGVVLCNFVISNDPAQKEIKVLNCKPEQNETYYNDGRVYQTRTIVLK